MRCSGSGKEKACTGEQREGLHGRAKRGLAQSATNSSYCGLSSIELISCSLHAQAAVVKRVKLKHHWPSLLFLYLVVNLHALYAGEKLHRKGGRSRAECNCAIDVLVHLTQVYTLSARGETVSGGRK